MEKASYLMGYNFIQELKAQQIELNMDQLIRGINDATAGKNPTMTDEEIRSVLIAFEKEVIKKQQEMFQRVAEKNLADGKAFLKNNAENEDVQQSESGLQYRVVKEGTGESPRITDRVKVHYQGSFPDGRVFDTSYGKEPQVLAVGSVIRGMAEALQQMKVGEKRQLFIPPELAYGARGQQPIGPNQTLVFEVELLEIVK